ncbi:class A beta-lactamase-related serine hydrolase [Sphingomonas sp. BN140010]|uniref:Beta-lactamase n=1 Tax=Sphingomonas arvum TaxID=2992113 RepID=A0ABT3JBF8_9SPHN|nr:serine hydrolase [Sphingomonas sp. BN140010]MCW3796395.1 class A beta-lactamase-related serine hydrolase [Sphingomonas sp. BN140010]
MRVLAVLMCWLSALAAVPAAAATSPSPEMRGLESQLAALLANRPGDIGVAALDLDSGKMVSVRGDKPYPMASTVKVAVAAAYLSQVDAGRRSLNDRIGSLTARQLLEAMLIHSNNGATDILIRNLGGPATVQGWIDFHHLSGIRVNRTIAQLLASPRDLFDIRDSATPEAMVTLLRQIDRGNVISPASRVYLLSVMRRCATGSNRIRGLLGPSVPVEHKTGTLNNYTSDVGFITMPDGRRIALALFARGGTDRPNSIAQAARAIYDGFLRLLPDPLAPMPVSAFGGGR